MSYDLECGVEQRQSPRIGLAASQHQGNCKFRRETPLPKLGVYHASRDGYRYCRAGVYVVGRKCPRSVGRCMELLHDLRELNKEIEDGSPSVLLFCGSFPAHRKESLTHLEDRLTNWPHRGWPVIVCLGYKSDAYRVY